MKLIIFGDSKINNLKVVEEALESFNIDITKVKEIAIDIDKGAGELGSELAKKHKLKQKEFKIDWKDISVPNAVIKENKFGKYNSAAAAMKDQSIADHIDVCLVLSINGDDSHTSSCLYKIKKAEKPIHTYRGSASQIQSDEERLYQF